MAISQQQLGYGADILAHTKAMFSPKLHSNDAVIKVGQGNAFTGLQEAVMRGRSGGVNEGSMMDAVKAAHKKNGDLDGDWDYGKIAGSTLTAGLGYRVLTGGGVYRDQNGQTNIAGVPFI